MIRRKIEKDLEIAENLGYSMIVNLLKKLLEEIDEGNLKTEEEITKHISDKIERKKKKSRTGIDSSGNIRVLHKNVLKRYIEDEG